MKKTLLVAIVMVLLLRAWLGAERHSETLKLKLVTSFDFAQYPACGPNRTINCIQAVRFYDADSKLRLAEVPAPPGRTTSQQITAALNVNSIPRRAYAVTVYADSNGLSKEGPPGAVSRFQYPEQQPR